MVLFKIHKMLKGNFSNELHVFFKDQNSISYFGSVIWNPILAELREINSAQVLKSEIKARQPVNEANIA